LQACTSNGHLRDLGDLRVEIFFVSFVRFVVTVRDPARLSVALVD
jgi:hypothetical protein